MCTGGVHSPWPPSQGFQGCGSRLSTNHFEGFYHSGHLASASRALDSISAYVPGLHLVRRRFKPTSLSLSLYLSISLYIYIYACINKIHIYIYIYICTYMYIHTYTYIHYEQMHMERRGSPAALLPSNTRSLARDPRSKTELCIYIYIHIYIYIYTYIYVSLSLYIYIYIYLHVLLYRYIYIYYHYHYHYHYHFYYYRFWSETLADEVKQAMRQTYQ